MSALLRRPCQMEEWLSHIATTIIFQNASASASSLSSATSVMVTKSNISSFDKFPLGIQMMNLWTKMSLKVFIVPPGRFYDGIRKQNLIVVNPGYHYIYTLRWGDKWYNLATLPCLQLLRHTPPQHREKPLQAGPGLEGGRLQAGQGEDCFSLSTTLLMFPLTVDRIIETSVQLFRALAQSPHPGPEDLSSKHQVSVWHLLSVNTSYQLPGSRVLLPEQVPRIHRV